VTEGRILGAGAQEFQGEVSALQRRGIPGTEQPGLHHHFTSTSPHGSIPEQLIDFVTGRGAGVSNAGQIRESSEWIGAQ